MGGKGEKKSLSVPVSTFLIILGTLIFLQYRINPPILLAERFINGGGWVEAVLLAFYGAWISWMMLDEGVSALWRRRIWTLFSFVFFLQLILGLVLDQRFLMSGELHLPVPAMIVAGPIYRTEGFFMPILYSATLLIVGPAWCSYLCYIGAWDNLVSLKRNRPTVLPKWRHAARIVIAALVILTAVTLRISGAPIFVAAWLGAAFGIFGVFIMMVWSRLTGSMTHCVVYCPIGLVSNYLGKISPFRIKIHDGCTRCGACTPVCRYDSLNPEHLERKRVGINCTLCGDCLTRCKDRQLDYYFTGLSSVTARNLFIVLIIWWHTVALGVARI